MEKRYLSTKEAEEYTGLCFKTLKKLWADGHIKAKRVNDRIWRWDKESIDAYFSFSEEDAKAELILHEVKERC